MKKRIFVLLWLLWFLCFPICGEEGTPARDYLGELQQSLPEQVRPYLDDGFFDGMEQQKGTAAADLGFWQRVVSELLGKAMQGALGQAAALLSLTVVLALLGNFGSTVASSGVRSVFHYVSVLVLAAACFGTVWAEWQQLQQFLDTLSVFIRASLPTAVALCAAGGNVTAAASANGLFLTAVAVLEGICRHLLYPVLSVCFSLSFIAVIGGKQGLGFAAVSGTVRKFFSFALGGMMTLLGFVLSHQTALAAATDGITSKTVKFAAGNLIPVIGGSLTEALKIVAGSLQYLKAAFGAIAVAAVVILVLPRLCSVWLLGMSFSLCGGVAELLGCGEEAGFLREIKGLCDLALSLCVCCGCFFIFAITTLVKIAAVIG